jgi:hypothetical protein
MPLWLVGSRSSAGGDEALLQLGHHLRQFDRRNSTGPAGASDLPLPAPLMAFQNQNQIYSLEQYTAIPIQPFDGCKL